MPDAPLLSVKGAAAMLGMTDKALYHHIKRGHLPCVKLGGRILIRREVVEALINGGA